MKHAQFLVRFVLAYIVCIGNMAGGRASAQPTSPAKQSVTLRVATFNVEDVRTGSLKRTDDARLKQLAEIIQRVRPDIVLLNEITYDMPGGPDVDEDDSPGYNAARFVRHYLSVSQAPGLEPIKYLAFMAPTNTGMPSGFDLDHNGTIVTTYPTQPGTKQTQAGREYGGDCWGFGTFPGQYGMGLLINPAYEVLLKEVRTFRLLPWNYMPGALLPTDPTTGKPWYNDEELTYFRLSSKSHWDVPVKLPNGRVLHVLCSHPTPPAFDGEEMRNQKRNHDEIRFWTDYLDNAAYIVDDKNVAGGIERGSAFVILGDMNADPDEGSSYKNPIALLLTHPLIDRTGQESDLHDAQTWIPKSDIVVKGLDADDTSHFGLRVDYVLPWKGIEIINSGIWRHLPTGSHGTKFPSDHYPVWIDMRVPPPRSS